MPMISHTGSMRENQILFTRTNERFFRFKSGISASMLGLLMLGALSGTLATTPDIGAIAVFINEGVAEVQVNVISEDKSDETVLPMRPGTIERTSFTGGQVKLYTPSKDIVSGRLLFSLRLPSPTTAPDFFEKQTRTFYFRVAGGKVTLLKPTDLTSKERKWLKERAKQGW
jgi:hypothetical protein